MTDALREKIARAMCCREHNSAYIWEGCTLSNEAKDYWRREADAILALLPKPTPATLLDRLALALSSADAAGYARGIEEAATLAKSYAQAQTMWAANVSDPAEKKQFKHGHDAIDGVVMRIRALKEQTQ